jgi:hypothetical protein
LLVQDVDVTKRGTESQEYQGVVARRGAFEAVFEVGGKRHRGGQWATAKEAAIARDRLVLALRRPQRRLKSNATINLRLAGQERDEGGLLADARALGELHFELGADVQQP